MATKILVIDDELTHAEALCLELNDNADVEAWPLGPSDIELADLQSADLVVTDYDLEMWSESEQWNGPEVLQPANGIALAATLAQQVWRREPHPPTGFALITGKPGDLMKPLPPDGRLHVVAGAVGLEWVFTKNEPRRAHKIAELARTLSALPMEWGGDVQQQLFELLDLEGAALNSRTDDQALKDDVLRCLPPVHEFSEWTHGLALVRWFCQRILPYPTFLLSRESVLARCGISLQELPDSSRFDSLMREAQYTGVLKDFMGVRWWRAGVESYLWQATDGESFKLERVREAVAEVLGISPETGKSNDDLVLCYDESFKVIDSLVPIDQAVRIRPDDWPAYADEPWAEIHEVRESDRLRSLVVFEDWDTVKSWDERKE